MVNANAKLKLLLATAEGVDRHAFAQEPVAATKIDDRMAGAHAGVGAEMMKYSERDEDYDEMWSWTLQHQPTLPIQDDRKSRRQWEA